MIAEFDSVKKIGSPGGNPFLRGPISGRTSGYHAAADYELLSDEQQHHSGHLDVLPLLLSPLLHFVDDIVIV